MIDVGLGQPGAREYLDAQLEVIDHLGALHEQIARLNPPPPTSELVRLAEAFPPHRSISRSRGCAQHRCGSGGDCSPPRCLHV
jgi:hypothetical protein